MDQSRITYDMIKKNIIICEDKIYYKKDKKPYIGCLVVQSKYTDQTDHIEFYLYANRTAKGPFMYLNLIEYKRAEKCIEQKKNIGWIASHVQKVLFSFELISKHEKENEIFSCEKEDNRNRWIKILNENIEKLNTNATYDNNLCSKQIYEENLNEDCDEIDVEDNSIITDDNDKLGGIISSISDKNDDDIKRQNLKSNVLSPQSMALRNELNSVLLKTKKITVNDDDFIYQGTFEELQKILRDINKPGVYAISQKLKPEPDCTLAIRVYENENTPLLSWNIYQNKNTKEYFLSEKDRHFFSINQLCSYYTKNNLPTTSSTINRLIGSYKHY